MHVDGKWIPCALLGAALVLAAGCGGGQEPEIRTYEEIRVEPAPQGMPEDFVHPPVDMNMEMPPAGMSQPAATAPAGRPQWDTPEGWEEQPGQGMRLATLFADTEDGRAECSVIVLGGNAGGLSANVVRWMGQVGIVTPPADELEAFLAEQTRFETAGGAEGVLVDLTSFASAEGQGSMLAGILTTPAQTVFIKMTGPAPALTSLRGEFLAFCRSFH